jgi:hypothetical protein
MTIERFFLLFLVILIADAVLFPVFLGDMQDKQPGQDIKKFMDGIKYGKDPRRGVCYAINPNYGYVFTYIPCEIQK